MAELNIAIAEDNPLMLELLGSILEEEDGFHVVGKWRRRLSDDHG